MSLGVEETCCPLGHSRTRGSHRLSRNALRLRLRDPRTDKSWWVQYGLRLSVRWSRVVGGCLIDGMGEEGGSPQCLYISWASSRLAHRATFHRRHCKSTNVRSCLCRRGRKEEVEKVKCSAPESEEKLDRKCVCLKMGIVAHGYCKSYGGERAAETHLAIKCAKRDHPPQGTGIANPFANTLPGPITTPREPQAPISHS